MIKIKIINICNDKIFENKTLKFGNDKIFDIKIIKELTVKNFNTSLPKKDPKSKKYTNGLKIEKETLDKSLGVYMIKHKSDGVIYVGSSGGDTIIEGSEDGKGWSLYHRIPQHRKGNFSKTYKEMTGSCPDAYLNDCELLILIVCDFTSYSKDKLLYRQQIRTLENYLNYKNHVVAESKGINFYSKK